MWSGMGANVEYVGWEWGGDSVRDGANVGVGWVGVRWGSVVWGHRA